MLIKSLCTVFLYLSLVISCPNIFTDRYLVCSILMECRDNANNSIFARRFVLYDTVSRVQNISTGNRGLHVSSAVEETNYKWQPNIGRKLY